MPKATKASTAPVQRVFFTEDDTALEVPSLLAHQKNSWKDFIETGLSEIFAELNPIEDYTGQKLELRFKDYKFQDPKNDEKFAKENNLTFDAPLLVNIELTNKVTGEVKEQEIYLGDYPWMTDRATFVINGTERVVVSQLIRSAGVFFTAEKGVGKNLYSAEKLIPGRGAWLEFETAANGALYVKIDRRRKIHQSRHYCVRSGTTKFLRTKSFSKISIPVKRSTSTQLSRRTLLMVSTKL